MKDEHKTKRQLTDELVELRQRIAELEHADIDRKQAEKALRKTNIFLSNILDSSSSISIISTDVDHNVLFWNKGAENIFGYKSEEIVGRHKIDVLYPEDEPDTKEKVEEIRSFILKNKKGTSCEIEEIRKDGRKLWISLTSTPRFDENGDVIGILGIGEDITERKRAEEQLQQSLEKFVLQAVFGGISDPLVLLDGEFSIKMLNCAAAKYYGVHKSREVIGKRCYEALRGGTEPCGGCPYPSVVLNGHGGVFEREGLMDPGKFEQVVIYPTEIGILMCVKDITKAKLMERQLVQGQKLASLGLMVSGIVHEIKNLNNCITFNIPILREYLKELIPIIDDYAERDGDFELFGMSYPEFRGDLFSLLGNLEHASGRISATVSDLGEFVRTGDKGRQRWVGLEEVIERGVTVCRCHVQRMVKSFEVDIDEDLCPIFTDPQALEQVVVNLLINAGQAAENEDSWVRLRARREDTCGDGVVIEVSDNGCGMDEEVKGKVFEPLFSTKGPGRGTGLGLFVAHNLIEELGGRIEVDSEPGKGSTFRIILNNANRRRMKIQQFSPNELPDRRQLPPK